MSSKNLTYVTLTMGREKENITETAINIETKNDNFGSIQPHNEENVDDWPTQSHNGKYINQIIVSRDLINIFPIM